MASPECGLQYRGQDVLCERLSKAPDQSPNEADQQQDNDHEADDDTKTPAHTHHLVNTLKEPI
jgi:hypothetical protein